jgi:cytochrome c553
MHRLTFPLLSLLSLLWLLPVLALGQQSPMAPAELDSMAQRVLPCVACHGKEGRATNVGYFPRIAGKPAGYLYAQLLNFRDGRRSNAVMGGLIENLSDAYLREIAEHFASLDLPYPAPQVPATPAAASARGEALVRLGDAARRIPACVQCHGDAMTGTLPAVPGLLGLPKDYLMSQLGAWRGGLRKATAPDCMALVATRLSPEDIGAVATWLASQPVPTHAKPAAPSPLPMPLDCGTP